jgi:hypothetical protein
MKASETVQRRTTEVPNETVTNCAALTAPAIGMLIGQICLIAGKSILQISSIQFPINTVLKEQEQSHSFRVEVKVSILYHSIVFSPETRKCTIPTAN